jgi:hypothetical protein
MQFLTILLRVCFSYQIMEKMVIGRQVATCTHLRMLFDLHTTDKCRYSVGNILVVIFPSVDLFCFCEQLFRSIR